MKKQTSKHNNLARVAKFVALCTLVTSITACPIEKNPPVDPPPPSPPSLAQQIKTLEDSGAYPKLDRSTDLKGPDQNLNGVRDDVEAWINAQPITDIQKKALMQEAEVLQKTLSVDLTNKAAVIALDNESMASTKCVGSAFSPRQNGYNLMDKVKAITFNTKERTMRYIQYNQTPGAASTRMPEGNTCK
ncbi:MAG TPA: hypothetical protein PK702_11415 [Burkholderiaceae bacterium]|nr:hypothetical protein [Burkholderiaceae bacterium]